MEKKRIDENSKRLKKAIINPEVRREETITNPEESAKEIVASPEEGTKELAPDRSISYNEFSLPSTSASGNRPGPRVRETFYGIALSTNLLHKHGIIIYHDKAAALKTMQRFKDARVRIFSNYFDAAQYAAQPLDEKKKSSHKHKKPKRSKNKPKPVGSDYFPSRCFRPTLETIHEDPASARNMELLRKYIADENEEKSAENVSNDPHSSNRTDPVPPQERFRDDDLHPLEDFSEDSQEDFPEDSLEDTSEDLWEDIPDDIPEDAPENPLEDAPEDSLENPPEDPENESTPENPRKNAAHKKESA